MLVFLLGHKGLALAQTAAFKHSESNNALTMPVNYIVNGALSTNEALSPLADSISVSFNPTVVCGGTRDTSTIIPSSPMGLNLINARYVVIRLRGTATPDTLYPKMLLGGRYGVGKNTDTVQVYGMQAYIPINGRQDATEFFVTRFYYGTLGVFRLPHAYAGRDSTICNGNPISLGDLVPRDSSKYEWTVLGNTDIIDTHSRATFTPVNTGTTPLQFTYQLRVKKLRSRCNGLDTVKVTVLPAPAMPVRRDTIMCSSDAVTFGPAPIAGLNYNWHLSRPANSIISYSDTGSSRLRFTGRNLSSRNDTVFFRLGINNSISSCTTVAQMRFVIKPGLPDAAGPDDTVCSDIPTVLGTDSVPGSVYTWSPAAGLSNVNAARPILLIRNTGINFIHLQYTLSKTDISGCTGLDTVEIYVHPRIDAEAGDSVKLCSNETVSIGRGPIITPGYAFSWLPVTGLANPNAAETTITLSNTSDTVQKYSYVRTVWLETLCEYRDTVLVHVLPTPKDTLFGPESVCPLVRGVSYGTRHPAAGNHYKWLVSGGTIAGSDTVSAIKVNWGSPSGLGAVKLVITNAYGCRSDTLRKPVDVNINLSPKIDTLQANKFCFGSRTGKVYKVAGVSILSTYRWKAENNGLPVPINYPTRDSTEVSIDWLQAGTASLTLTEISEAGGPGSFECSGTGVLDIIIYPDPPRNPKLTFDSLVCADSSIHTYKLAGGPGTYDWHVFNRWGQDLTDSVVVGNRTDSIVNFRWLNNGTYFLSVQQTALAPALCPGTRFTRLISVSPLPHTTASPDNDLAVCKERLISNRYVVSGRIGSAFTWTITGGTLQPGYQGNDTVLVDWNEEAGTRSISVYEVTERGCRGFPITLNIKQDYSMPSFRVSADTSNKGLLFETQLLNPENNPSDSVLLQMQVAGGTWVNLGIVPKRGIARFPNVADSLAGTFRVQTVNLCKNNIYSDVKKNIVLDAEAVESYGKGHVNLNWNAYEGWPDARYLVYLSADSGAAGIIDAAVTGGTSKTAETYMEGFRQCFRIRAVNITTGEESWSNMRCVKFKHDLVPTTNIFTPGNGDGINDTWEIPSLPLYGQNSVVVYNRWGKTVYKSDNYNNDWDGANLPAETYYYIITLKSNNRKITGWVQINR
ncbi:MAG: gliding motility-associated C-terminal domain-containing protein [Bacteroidota bacterium]